MGRSKDNYKLLRQYFDTSREEQIRMTFEEIARIIGTSYFMRFQAVAVLKVRAPRGPKMVP